MNSNRYKQPGSPSSRKLPPVTLLIAVISLAAACLPNLSTVLQYDHTAIAGG